MLTSNQLLSLVVATRLSAMLSIVSGIYFGRHVWKKWKEFDTGLSGVIASWVLAGTIQACVLFISREYVDPTPQSQTPPTTACQFHGLMVVWLFITTGIWPAIFALNLHLVLFKNSTFSELQNYDQLYRIVVWVASFFWTLNISVFGGEYAFGNGTLWCSIADSRALSLLCAKMLPVWIGQIYTFIVYLAAGYKFKTSPQFKYNSAVPPSPSAIKPPPDAAPVEPERVLRSSQSMDVLNNILAKAQEPESVDTMLEYTIRSGLHLVAMFLIHFIISICTIIIMASSTLNYGCFMTRALFEPMHSFLTVIVYFMYPRIEKRLQLELVGRILQIKQSVPKPKQDLGAASLIRKHGNGILTMDALSTLGIVEDGPVNLTSKKSHRKPKSNSPRRL